MRNIVSFIVPVFNSEKTIGKCIESVLGQGTDKEILVVDNNSTDGSATIIKNYEVTYFFEEKRGPAATRNKGLENAKGEFIAFIDSDVVLPRDWTKRALELLHKDKSLAGVGGPGTSVDKNVVSRALDALLFGTSKNVKEKCVNSLATMDVLYKREVIEDLRFDETFILPAGEDQEFNFRIRKRGYKLLYSRDLFVYHHHPTNFKALLKRWYNYGKFYSIPYLKHKEMRNIGFYTRVLYMPIFVLLVLLYFVNPLFIYLALMQVFLLFVIYLYIGLKVCRGSVLLAFPFVHALKQLAQLTGIWAGFIKKIS